MFIFEGVSYYLDPDSVKATLDLAARNTSPDTTLSFDYTASLSSEDLQSAYGVMELMESMASRHPNEQGRFSLSDQNLETFLEKQGLRLLEHWDNRDMENKYLTRKKGSSIGKITGWFRFATVARSFS